MPIDGPPMQPASGAPSAPAERSESAGRSLRDWLRSPIVAWLVLAISLSLTAAAWYVSDRSVRRNAQESFAFKVDEARASIARRMQEYEQVLRGGTGLFAASSAVTRSEWNTYHAMLQVEKHYPGIQGYGFSLWIDPRDKVKLVDQVRSEGFPSFDLRPPGERDEYAPIVFLEPMAGRNLRAFGYDMWSEPVRRAAMTRARDGGEPALTGRVTLVQETDQAPQPGVLMYVPVYRNGAPIATVEQRRAALHGFVYSPFRMYDLMRGILGPRDPEVAFVVYDGADLRAESLLIDIDRDFTPMAPGYVPSFVRTEAIEIAGRTWTLQFHSRPAFDAAVLNNQPLQIAFGGMAVDLLLFVIISQLWVERQRAAGIAVQATDELRRSERRASLIVDASPTAVVMTDREGRIVLVNVQAERLFGWARDELLGRTIEVLLPQALQAAHPRLRASFAAAPQSRPMGAGRDLNAVHKDGSEFPVEIGLNPIDTADGPMVLATALDVSERKAAQRRLERELTEKTVLLNEVHHRVKNNLQVISSLLSLQSGRSEHTEVRRALEDSRARVQAMALIHRLLYESRGFVSIDLGQYLKDLVRLLKDTHPHEAGRVTLRLDVQTQVVLDLQRAVPCGLLVNELISNALKHAFPARRSGEVRVSIGIGADGLALISVQDDGIGLPVGFDIANSSTLGLRLVDMLCIQIGGTLSIGAGPGVRLELRFAASETIEAAA